jgi:hypothetical protein
MVEMKEEEEGVEAGRSRDEKAKTQAHMYHPYVM